MKFEGELPKIPDNLIRFDKKKFDNGHWKFPEQMGSKEYVGFIYLIRDNYLGRFYLGKKAYRGSRGKNEGKESDWRHYVSSSKLLKEMWKERPIEEFEFITLEQYRTKGTLSYAETWTLCFVEAPTSVTWYNKLIPKVAWSVKEPISNRHKERLDAMIRMKPNDE